MRLDLRKAIDSSALIETRKGATFKMNPCIRSLRENKIEIGGRYAGTSPHDCVVDIHKVH